MSLLIWSYLLNYFIYIDSIWLMWIQLMKKPNFFLLAAALQSTYFLSAMLTKNGSFGFFKFYYSTTPLVDYRLSLIFLYLFSRYFFCNLLCYFTSMKDQKKIIFIAILNSSRILMNSSFLSINWCLHHVSSFRNVRVTPN